MTSAAPRGHGSGGGEEAGARRQERRRPSVRRSAAALAVSVVVLGGLVAPVGASADTPFRGHLVATVELRPDPACGGFHITATATGRATHLGGRATAVFDECADFVREPGRVHVYGTAVLTAPNGDELRLWLDKSGNPPDAEGDVHVAGPYRVTGGTGRFARAAGSGTTTTGTNVTSTVALVELLGTLQMVADS